MHRIGVRALVSAVAVVVLLATAVWLTQPWNSGTDQSILPVGSVAHTSGGEPVEAADHRVRSIPAMRSPFRHAVATAGPDLDKNWCENADGHYPEGQPVMSVMYGQPGSSDLTTNLPPGHSLQVMEIVCFDEDWPRMGSSGTTVWQSPDSPWYGR